MISKFKNKLLSVFLVSLLILSGCAQIGAEQPANTTNVTTEQTELLQDTTVSSDTSSEQLEPSQIIDGDLTISYLDIGQGDSIFVQLPNEESILIDAGNKGDSSKIIQYIKDSGEDTLDYVIATHPHADHIGSMAEVIDSFEVKNIYMPKVAHTSQTYENLLDTISEKGMTIDTAKAGKIIFDYDGIKAQFLAPNSENYSDLNNYSAVVLLTYNDTRFLFTGDAESESEDEILENGFDVSADVLKVGHHGSKSSSTKRFIKAVKPKYAIISVGEGNRYGHPDMAALDIFQENNAEIWRTDEKGTIVVTSDGRNITVKNIVTSTIQTTAPPVSKSAEPSTESYTEPYLSNDNQSITVYITRTGTKYHRDGCKYLKSSKIPIVLDELNTNKYEPCKVCKPPVQ